MHLLSIKPRPTLILTSLSCKQHELNLLRVFWWNKANLVLLLSKIWTNINEGIYLEIFLARVKYQAKSVRTGKGVLFDVLKNYFLCAWAQVLHLEKRPWKAFALGLRRFNPSHGSCRIILNKLLPMNWSTGRSRQDEKTRFECAVEISWSYYHEQANA